jgi:hypothetical protein
MGSGIAKNYPFVSDPGKGRLRLGLYFVAAGATAPGDFAGEEMPAHRDEGAASALGAAQKVHLRLHGLGKGNEKPLGKGKGDFLPLHLEGSGKGYGPGELDLKRTRKGNGLGKTNRYSFPRDFEPQNEEGAEDTGDKKETQNDKGAVHGFTSAGV